ncbi:hypothetical protein [uncultured Rubinisphaera sp.]|uniref:hypothetical protein n=1 Tax=uncultured Rubinisphaera sp. TaxID=1678686 RepID=UPI0030DB7B01
MKNNAFKIFSKELDPQVLSSSLRELGFEVVQISKPTSAYENEIIKLRCGRLEKESVTIVVEREYWPDGNEYEDKSISILLAEDTKLNLNIEEMLRNKHKEALRTIIWARLAECLSEISGEKPNVA